MTISLKRSLLINILCFIFFFILSLTSFAQENTSDKIIELRDQIRELEKQSAEYKKLIVQKHQEGETLKREVAVLENQIAKLRVNILVTSRQVELTGLEIGNLNEEIFETQVKVEKNKAAVSSILRELYSFEKQDLAAIVLANSKLSDFFSQIEYLNGLRERLTANLKVFIDLKEELEARRALAQEKKNELEVLNRRRQNQQVAFEGTKDIKDDLLVKTKGQEARFQSLLTETEREMERVYTELRKFEEEAREQGIFIVRVKAPSIPPKGKIFRTPMEDYIITQYYGMTPFVRSRPDIYGGVPHNGVDLKSGFGSEIRAVGPGTVLAKGFNNAAGNWAAIRHTNDLVSVYAHMRDPALVLADERVSENTVLGFEGQTGLATGSHLHFSLYHEFFTFIGPITGQIYFNSWEGSLNPFDYF